ncbi:MAG: ribosome silencing factor [Planctomycetota bacterium]
MGAIDYPILKSEKNRTLKKIVEQSEREWLIFLAKFLHLKKIENIIILELNKENYVVDYFIIGTVKMPEHSFAVVNELKRISKQLNSKIPSVEGLNESGWTIVKWDFCALHLFTENIRNYYNIEELWVDAKRIYWRNARLTTLPHPKKLLSTTQQE